MKNLNVLVIGATGLVGAEVVRQLVASGIKPRLFVRNKDKAMQVHGDGFEIFTGEIANLKKLQQAMQGCTAIYNCVGEKSGDVAFYATNQSGVKNVATAAENCAVEFLCHVSSVSVTGKVSVKNVDEETACNPMNDYEKSKHLGELELQGCSVPKIVILRPAHVFAHDTMQHFANLSKLRLLLKGNENANLVYVKDVAAAAVWLLQNSAKIADHKIEKFIISSNHETGNTIAEVNNFIKAGGVDNGARVIALPLIFPYLMRKLRFGDANWGDVAYSSKKLRDLGFKLPYGWKAGMVELLKTK